MRLIASLLVCFTIGQLSAQDELITIWKTDNNGTSGTTEVTIPTRSSTYTYDYDVDWNNDGIYDTLGVTGDITHDYGVAGTQTIRITGTFPQFYFNNSGDKEKILEVSAWGDISWESGKKAFYGCSNMDITAVDTINFDQSIDVSHMFNGCTSLVGNSTIASWDVSGITSMQYFFQNCSSFNIDIGNWTTDNLNNMYSMFRGASTFNQDIGGWNLGNASIMGYLFYDATDFNQDISGWDVSDASTMTNMFKNASSFDQNLGNWDISGVSNMASMFSGIALSKSNYDSTLIGWASQTVQSNISFSGGNSEYCISESERSSLISTFGWTIIDGGLNCIYGDEIVSVWQTDNAGSSGTTEITIPTNSSTYTYLYDVDWDLDGTYDTIGVTGDITHDYGVAGTQTIRIRGTFPQFYFNDTGDKEKIIEISAWGEISWESGKKAFSGCSNMDITATDTLIFDQVTDVSNMFNDCSSLVGNSSMAGWDVSNITNMQYLFRDCSSFNIDINNWTVSNVQTMYSLFRGASNFNQDISGWNVGNVDNMSYMFLNAYDFDQDISGWNVSDASLMNLMFKNATSFDQNLGSWDVSGVTQMTSMFSGVTLSTANYDSLLIGWNSQNLQSGVTFDGGNSMYCAGEYARANMIANESWTITDGGPDDTTAPVADLAVLADVTADCEVTALTDPTATDGCASVVIVSHDATLPITTEGTTTITWTYDDGHGNTSTQTQNVVIDDLTGPVADVATLADVTAECEVTALTAPTATDACGGSVTVTNDATLPFSTQGTTVVTWTYEDDHGNTSTQTQNVIIDDITAPVADATTLTDLTAECELTGLTAPTATDACGGSVSVTNDAVLPITTQGTTVVTWTYDDGHGNTSTQTQNVIVDDVTAPTPNLASLSDVSSTCEVTSLTAPSATDNCVASPTVTSDAIFPLTEGTNIVTWTYDDGNGNTSTQVQNVIVDDVTAPVPDVATLSDVTAECEVTTLTAPTGTDECATSVTVTSDAILPISALGTTVVTWTYDDGHGNTTTQTQDVIINAIDAGTTIAANGVTIEADNTDAGVTYQWIDCSTNLPITGETGQSFTPTSGGDYAVIVSQNGCSETSTCVNSTVGLEDLTTIEVLLYPNPSNGNFTIKSDQELLAIDVIDMLGRVVLVDADLHSGTVNGSNLSSGRYFVQIMTSQATATKEFIVRK